MTYRLQSSAFITIALRVGLALRLGAQSAPESATTRFHYPPARVSDQTDMYFGTTVRDPYRWLEDANSPEARTWVAAEDSLTYGYLRALPERAAIKQALTRIWNFPKYSAPEHEGRWFLSSENTGLQNQSVFYVQANSLTGPRRVLLDPNILSADGHIAAGIMAASPAFLVKNIG